MDKKTTLHTNAASSNGMKALLLDPDITIQVAGVYDLLEKILLQLQRDILAENRKDMEGVGWAEVRGVDHVNDTLLLFKKEGEGDLYLERQTKLKNTTKR